MNRSALQDGAFVAGGGDPGLRKSPPASTRPATTSPLQDASLVAGGADPGQPASPRPATTSPLQDAIGEVLHQGELLLNSLTDEEYTRKLPNVFGSTIGEHFRHCLDHFQSLLQGLDADEINYDHRQRNPRIEKDRDFALAETHRILRAFASIARPFLDCPTNVRSKVNYERDAAPLIASTVGRELMYAVAHTIHHYALIAVMCAILEIPVPAGFGVAPSTLQYHAEQPKAA